LFSCSVRSGERSGEAAAVEEVLARGGVVVAAGGAEVARAAVVPRAPAQDSVGAIASVIVGITSVYWTRSCTPTAAVCGRTVVSAVVLVLHPLPHVPRHVSDVSRQALREMSAADRTAIALMGCGGELGILLIFRTARCLLFEQKRDSNRSGSQNLDASRS